MVRAEHLRIGRLAHLKPLQTALSGVVYALCALEVVVPIPLFAGVLFNESDGVADLLSGIFLNVLVHMTQRRCQLEHGDTVLKLHALGDNAVAEQRAVAGGVALNGAAAEDGRIVIDRNSGFRLGHGAYVACKAVFLSNVNDMVLRRAC